MYEELKKINSRPKPFAFYTASDLWTDEYTSEQMLKYHLNEDVDLSSRNTDFIDRSVGWIASHFSVGSGTKIADFGSGPGLYTTRLSRRGATVTGIDFSKKSIDYASNVASDHGLSIQYLHQNYLDFETDDRFDLIIMIMCDFSVLSPEQRMTMLEKFHRLLEQGGSVLLDVHSLSMFEQREETAVYGVNTLDGFWSRNRYYGFLNTFKYEREKVILDKYTLVEANRTRMFYNWFQCFSRDALKMEFEKCGFTVANFYSDVAGSPFDSESNEFAIVARKL